MIISADQIYTKAYTILRHMGSSEYEAEIVANHLLLANLKGHDSHGIGMLVFYVESAKNGTLKVNQTPEKINDIGAIMQFDAKRGFGQRIAHEAMLQALERVEETGIVLLTVKNNHHLGRIGTYGELAANAGKIALFFVNVIDFPTALVAPFAGSEARFGTNPICITFPKTEKHPAFLLDFATSMVALGKTRVKYLAGDRFEEEVMLDAKGIPTNNPSVMHEEPKGALRPIALHKGGGLITATEFLAGLLSGGGTNQDQNPREGGIINNLTAIIIDPSRLADLEWLQAEYDAMIEYIKSSPAPNEPILMAGEPELVAEAKRRQEGIKISKNEWNAILEAEKMAQAL